MTQTAIKRWCNRYCLALEQGWSLGVYRITFGALMVFSLLRFVYKGWVETCYLSPGFHFTYQYFHWVHPFQDTQSMYLVVYLTIAAAAMLMLGLLYRVAAVVFFIGFTYLELIEQSWYLNHYYFVAIIAFLLIWMPAHHRFSLDRYWLRPARQGIRVIYANVLRLQISLVYFFAGLAKLNPDWLLHALPLKIWLKAKVDIPLIGGFLGTDAAAWLFSYAGAGYDLMIPFLLWHKKTRPYALIAVVAFHAMTALLFQIGMFPWIMIVGSLIFITDQEWESLWQRLRPQQSIRTVFQAEKRPLRRATKWVMALFVVHLMLQIILPLRHFGFAENHRWTERYFRFAWNVMLVEKNGAATFTIQDTVQGRRWKEYPERYLDKIQVKQMAFQADMIWQYAHFLADQYRKKGVDNPVVTAEVWVSFNGRPSTLYLPDTLNLLSVSEDEIYDYVLPMTTLSGY